jgi:hypothetical protein
MSSVSSDLLINPQDLFDITVNSATTGVSNGVTQLGALATTGDGRYYRFILAGGTALVPGKLQQSSAEVTGNENLTAVAAAIGATSLVSTSTVTVTANQYAGGYAMITTGTGVGYMYQIGSHAAFTSAAPTFSLVDPILVALDTTSRIDLIANPYTSIIINPSAASGMPVGVAVAATPSAYYGWVACRGATNVLADGTVTVGTTLVASNGVAGAVEPFAGVQQIVGIAIAGIATTEYGAVHLTIS